MSSPRTTSAPLLHLSPFERLTQRLSAEGFRHPEGAATARVARGDTGLDFDQFCRERHLIPDLWQQAEEGWLAPAAVERLLDTTERKIHDTNNH